MFIPNMRQESTASLGGLLRPHMGVWLQLIFKLFISGTSCSNCSFVLIIGATICNFLNLQYSSNTAGHLVIGVLKASLQTLSHSNTYSTENTPIFGRQAGINPAISKFHTTSLLSIFVGKVKGIITPKCQQQPTLAISSPHLSCLMFSKRVIYWQTEVTYPQQTDEHIY